MNEHNSITDQIGTYMYVIIIIKVLKQPMTYEWG